MQKVIIDSNFLFIPVQFKVDIFEDISRLLNHRIDFVLLSTNYMELEKIAEHATPQRRQQAKMALQSAAKCHVIRVEKKPNETYDDVIVRVALNWKCPVATNDQKLRKRLRNEGIPVIFLRQRSRLALES